MSQRLGFNGKDWPIVIRRTSDAISLYLLWDSSFRASFIFTKYSNRANSGKRIRPGGVMIDSLRSPHNFITFPHSADHFFVQL